MSRCRCGRHAGSFQLAKKRGKLYDEDIETLGISFFISPYQKWDFVRGVTLMANDFSLFSCLSCILDVDRYVPTHERKPSGSIVVIHNGPPCYCYFCCSSFLLLPSVSLAYLCKFVFSSVSSIPRRWWGSSIFHSWLGRIPALMINSHHSQSLLLLLLCSELWIHSQLLLRGWWAVHYSESEESQSIKSESESFAAPPWLFRTICVAMPTNNSNQPNLPANQVFYNV